ncbi:protein Mdm4 isoform X2 [Brienomyrus brachyistius]|uniref:protein Mdm4 isoform X2 n=1 Tax=Brienomyrus brachyistius TaxID=42636 RepID=UPI0020B24B33|nr:protein Mdm4 isoform X2 [Brienomyrus brachyistius]
MLQCSRNAILIIAISLPNMTTLSNASQYPGSSLACRLLPGDGTQVQPKAALLQLLCLAGAQGETFTLKEVMHYLGQYIMVKQLYDKQRQHIVHCQDDPLGELLEVESFSVKNPNPVYEMLKKNLIILNNADAAKNLSVGKDSNEPTSEDPGQTSSGPYELGQAPVGSGLSTSNATSQRRQREPDGESLDGVPRSACKRPKLDVSLDEWDLTGLPWWFLGNLRSNYVRKSNGSTDLHTNQDEDTAIVSDTTDDLWFLNEAESEQVSVEMKETVHHQGSDGELHEEEEGVKEDKEMQEDLDEDSQCLSDDTDTEILTQDAWQCTECRKYNSPLQRYCMHCWALRRDWYKDCPRLAHAVSVPELPITSSSQEVAKNGDDIDVPDCRRTVSDPVILPSHSSVSRPLSSIKDKSYLQLPGNPKRGGSEGPGSSEGDSQDMLEMEMDERPEALLEPCKLCRVRPRNGNIIHGRTAHLITCFSCARKLHKFHAPCPSCGQIIQKVIKTFIA